MEIVGYGNDCFLYVNGITTSTPIKLHENICLLPAKFVAEWDKIARLLNKDIDYAVAMLAHSTIGAQLHITSSCEKSLCKDAWDAQWDCILLGALFKCDVMCNLQSDQPVDRFAEATYLHVTNHEFRALMSKVYPLSTADEQWLEKNYESAHRLLDYDTFRTAVHALATYRWHTMPRVQLAIIWSGIESLFNVNSEITFRISLYISNFLCRDNKDAQQLFKEIKKMYSLRSSAVHGNKIKDDIRSAVSEAADLLQRIIRRCAETNSLPNIEDLVFNAKSSLSGEPRGQV